MTAQWKSTLLTKLEINGCEYICVFMRTLWSERHIAVILSAQQLSAVYLHVNQLRTAATNNAQRSHRMTQAITIMNLKKGALGKKLQNTCLEIGDGFVTLPADSDHIFISVSSLPLFILHVLWSVSLWRAVTVICPLSNECSRNRDIYWSLKLQRATLMSHQS